MPAGLKEDASNAPAGCGVLELDPDYAFTELNPEKTVNVLAISPHEEDHLFLDHIFSHSRWIIHGVRTCGEALAFLRLHPMPVVLCERDLPDSDWKNILRQVESMRQPPQLIVTSRIADDQLWAEVLNLGGYDVLLKPFDAIEVIRVISLAWLHWKNLRARPAWAAGD